MPQTKKLACTPTTHTPSCTASPSPPWGALAATLSSVSAPMFL